MNVNQSELQLKNASLRKATNLSLNQVLLAEARELGINISRSAEKGIEQAVIEARREAWLEENADALESSNSYIEEHGLPLDGFRQF